MQITDRISVKMNRNLWWCKMLCLGRIGFEAKAIERNI